MLEENLRQLLRLDLYPLSLLSFLVVGTLTIESVRCPIGRAGEISCLAFIAHLRAWDPGSASSLRISQDLGVRGK